MVGSVGPFSWCYTIIIDNFFYQTPQTYISEYSVGHLGDIILSAAFWRTHYALLFFHCCYVRSDDVFFRQILVAFLISLFFHYHAPTLRLYGGLASHHGDRERPQRNGRPSVPPSLARRAIPCEPVYSVRGAPCKFLLFWVDVKYCLLLLDTLVSKNNC